MIYGVRYFLSNLDINRLYDPALVFLHFADNVMSLEATERETPDGKEEYADEVIDPRIEVHLFPDLFSRFLNLQFFYIWRDILFLTNLMMVLWCVLEDIHIVRTLLPLKLAPL